ncbi:MAG: putative ABC-type ATPase [Candidatus Omnitrophota bacterium]|jgi:predicted ABC-type ATPase
MNIWQFKPHTTKGRVLLLFFNKPAKRYYLREIAGLLDIDPANLSRDLDTFVKEGLLTVVPEGKQKFFALNKEYAFYDELKSIAYKTALAASNRISQSKKTNAVYVIAGPNGAGKTTFAKTFLPDQLNCHTFINADLIAAGIAPLAPDAANLRAGRLLLEEIKRTAQKKIDFAFETTLSGKSYTRLFKELSDQGYAIHLFFLWLPNVQLSIRRVAQRVKRGGHHIPTNVIRRRFNRGIHNLFHVYQDYLESWTIFDNSSSRFEVIANTDESKEIQISNQAAYSKILKIRPN